MKYTSKQDLSAFNEFYSEVKELSKYQVRYGYFDDVHYSELTMATLAAMHEQGWGNLPERNFIYSTQMAFKGDLNKQLKRMYRGIIAKKGFRSYLDELGKKGVKAIKQTIDTGKFSNPKVTQEWANVKGFSEALVHYGDLRAATTYRVSLNK